MSARFTRYTRAVVGNSKSKDIGMNPPTAETINLRIFRLKTGLAFTYGEKKIARKTRRIPYRDELADLYIQYANALDNPDLVYSSIQLWKLLEQITGTIKHGELVERATWIIAQEADVKRNILDAMRTVRNDHVHGKRTADRIQSLGFEVKSVVDFHLRVLTENCFQVRSPNEYAQVLAMPTDLSKLARHKHLCAVALKQRHKIIAADQKG